MSIGTLSDQDRLLVHALHNARQGLLAAKLKPYVEERDVRLILLDISCEALQPLPLSIEVYLPKSTLKISSQGQIDDIIAAIDVLGSSLVQR